jgi:hypothetical protein
MMTARSANGPKTFAKAVPFSGLPAELQTLLLSEEKNVVPDAETPSTRQPAA